MCTLNYLLTAYWLTNILLQKQTKLGADPEFNSVGVHLLDLIKLFDDLKCLVTKKGGKWSTKTPHGIIKPHHHQKNLNEQSYMVHIA